MQEPESQEAVNLIRGTQIIHVAMMMGVVLLLGAIWVIKPKPMNGEMQSVFLIISMAAAGAGFMLSLILPTLLAKSQAATLARQSVASAGELLRAIQQGHIIRLATLEGPAMLAGVFQFLTGNPLFTAIAATLVVIMAMFFPTRGKFVEQAQALEDRIAMLRQSGG